MRTNYKGHLIKFSVTGMGIEEVPETDPRFHDPDEQLYVDKDTAQEVAISELFSLVSELQDQISKLKGKK